MASPIRAAAAVAGGVLALLLAGPARAVDIVVNYPSGGSTCYAGCCGKVPCPPPFHHVSEGPPCLHIQKGCGRPVKDPCGYRHFGHYATCWCRWPFSPDHSYCPCPQAVPPLPAVQNNIPPTVNSAPAPGKVGLLPAPRPVRK
jgi:hypothetical protein